MPPVSDRLNPLPVGAGMGPAQFAGSDGEGMDGLLWALVAALAPLACDLALTVAIGRPLWSISLFHIGISLFGLTLAALVRILSHGRGRSYVPLLFLFAVLEVLIALYFGGTFSRSVVRPDSIRSDIVAIAYASPGARYAPMRPDALERVRDDLGAVQAKDPENTTSGYLMFAGFGLFSLVVLLRYWNGPTASERQLRGIRESRGRRGT